MTPEQQMEMAKCNVCQDIKTGLESDALSIPLGAAAKATYTRRSSAADERRRSEFAWADEIVSEACHRLEHVHLKSPDGAVCKARSSSSSSSPAAGRDYCEKAKPLVSSFCPSIVSEEDADERAWIDFVLDVRRRRHANDDDDGVTHTSSSSSSLDPCTSHCKLQNQIQRAVSDAQEKMKQEMRDSFKLSTWEEVTLLLRELSKPEVW
eukprot:CAMPEP_0176467330 /NCGR_PEP_ID=MMETSP0127-20121128/38402_1 /TAXON_ID=938130 /ORGANISM="Platyophrya macrostoma, Strain WH" /LENGTH=207 /DNA_ID=CAMNT_0017860625 /DNA_START=168 /DNA_END=788 /DNA_ORIENTATION=+